LTGLKRGCVAAVAYGFERSLVNRFTTG